MTDAAPSWSRESVKPPVEAPTSSARRPRTSGPPNAATALASLTPPRETKRGRSSTSTTASSRTICPALLARSPPTRTSPAMTDAAARERESNRPRWCSRVSNRTLTTTRTVAARRPQAGRPPADRLRLVALRIEDEHLDRHLGIEVRLAHEGADAPPGGRLDGRDEAVAQHVVEGVARLADLVGAAGGDQRALRGGEHVFEDDEHVVLGHVGAGARRAAPEVLGVEPDDGVGDGRAGGSAVAGQVVFGAL